MPLTVGKTWLQRRIREAEITRYMDGDCDFVPDATIEALLVDQSEPDPPEVRATLQKSLAVENLTPAETAVLMRVRDGGLLAEMQQTALTVKKQVYGNGIVTFAPLYMGSYCVNNCRYCGFRRDNTAVQRKVLSLEEIKREAAILAGKIGHRRLVAVYGEHPYSDVDYIIQGIQAIYSVRVPVPNGSGIGQINRVNISAPPFCIDELQRIKAAGLGTYQVFQETYHRRTYAAMHPHHTPKGHFRWRLYAMHRAFEAGIDDVGIGVLFGLYDWRFELLGLVCHAWELKQRLGLGPHTVSCPRLQPAYDTPLTQFPWLVDDAAFLKILVIMRLAMPSAGMIVTAREGPQVRRQAVDCGITQMDASCNMAVGGYQQGEPQQQEHRQQFMLGDTRSLDAVVRELAECGYLTSFCAQDRFCRRNAVLTYKAWLDDFATPPTRAVGEAVLHQEACAA
jgi:2-iminoacetate synthase